MKLSAVLFGIAIFTFLSCKKTTDPTPFGATITSFSPNSGMVGSTVTINGLYLTGTTSIIINGITVTNFTVVNDSTITFTVPAGATTGTINITTSAGTTVGGTFTVLAGSAPKLVAYSSAFVNNGLYPKLYTCDSTGIAPPIAWRDAPAGTNAYAITMHTITPTPPNHVYMVVYNLPASVFSVPENNTTVGTYGANTFANPLRYEPPCSQGPGLKYYYITVYALSQQPTLTVPQSQVTMDVLQAAMSGITLDTSMITIGYARP
ncbi:MAG: hypothetical protein WCH52_10050, partial [Bacteroidota bacterium]